MEKEKDEKDEEKMASEEGAKTQTKRTLNLCVRDGPSN